MSVARAAAGPQTTTMPAPLRRAGGDEGTSQAVQALGENEEVR
ncbi:hypothetical protein ABZ543_29020 [Streptomyces roseifaciens]